MNFQKIIDGETYLTPEGVLQILINGAFDNDEGNERRQFLLLNLCKYLSSKRYGTGATKIFEMLRTYSAQQRADWSRVIYRDYVSAENIKNLLQYGEC